LIDGQPPLVVLYRLRSEAAIEVANACNRAGARAVPATSASDGPRASLVVAALPAGARRIPDDIVEALHLGTEATPLLLLCDEVLARPATTLHGGRVTLLERPCSPTRLYSQIRILLASAQSSEGLRREHAHPFVWFTEIGEATSSAAMSLEGDGVTGVVPLVEDANAADVLREADDVLRGSSDRGVHARELADRIGSRAGVIHLSPKDRQWVFYWPSRAGSLWFYSPGRLPSLSELSRSANDSLFLTLGASTGDVAVAVTSPIAEQGDPGSSESLRALAARIGDGAPALADEFGETIATGAFLSGFVAEVR